jgi:tetratricopeptide (TPR) repeat protein
LENWWRATCDPVERQQLRAVLRAAEPAEAAFWEQWWSAARKGDGAALARMVDNPDVQQFAPMAVPNVARDLAIAKEWAAAERLLNTWRQRYPDNFWLNQGLGIVLLEQKSPQPEKAVRYLTAAVALRPDSAGAHYNLGNALRIAGDPAEAMRCYQTALRHDPRFASAHINLASVLKQTGDVEGAVREYHAALEADPQVSAAHFGLALIRVAQGDKDEAIREYQAALRINPRDVQSHTNLGNLLSRQDVEGAIRCYQTALQIDPQFVSARYNLGIALSGKGDRAGAIREYRAALKADPNHFAAHINLGTCLKAEGDTAGAIREFRDALRIDPQDVRAHCNLAVALRAAGDLKGAIRSYQDALKIDPRSALTHRALGVVLSDSADIEGAIREYRAAIDIDPQDAVCHFNLGLALTAKRDLEGAVGEYRATIQNDPRYAEAYCNLGEILGLQGHFNEALDALKAGHSLGSRRSTWSYPSATWVSDAEEHVLLDALLTNILRGEMPPADAAPRLRLAWLCRQPYKQLYALGARLSEEAFAADARLADDLESANRYSAACSAALAGCGKGKDADQLGETERTRLRGQALEWLRSELAAWTKLLSEKGPTKIPIDRRLQQWRSDPNLTAVRKSDELDRLPAGERKLWQEFWANVETLIQQARQPKP